MCGDNTKVIAVGNEDAFFENEDALPYAAIVMWCYHSIFTNPFNYILILLDEKGSRKPAQNFIFLV